ncbi:MAG: hypothetical protein Kilf2KO_10420 [Rhodospirillales bacterium]
MFVAAETIGLFPTLIYRSQPLPGGPATLQGLASALAPQLPPPEPQRPRRRTQPALQEDPAFQPLVAQVVAWAEEVLAQSAQKPQDCLVTALWGEAAPAAFGEPMRPAANAHLTFILPLIAPAGLGVRVADPRPQSQVIVPMVSAPNEFNAREVTVPLVPGQALLLPGWLPHALQGGVGQGGGGQSGGGPGEMLLLRGQTLFRAMDRAISPPMWTGMTKPLA